MQVAVPEVSVIVPCRDEADNLAFLVDEIAAALVGWTFEVIIVDDGSEDATAERIESMAEQERPWLRLVRHDVAAGQSCAIRSGLHAAAGALIATIDGDGENDPAYLPQLLAALKEGGGGVGLVAGQRLKRKAGPFKRLASRIANGVRSRLLGDGTRDTGCGLKAVRREVFLVLPYFDGWHRFLPALVLREGYAVTHVDVIDRNRRHGVSKYGILDRLWAGLLDLFGVWWLCRRRRRLPLVREIRIARGENSNG